MGEQFVFTVHNTRVFCSVAGHRAARTHERRGEHVDGTDRLCSQGDGTQFAGVHALYVLL
jgi:hypothetical protein